MGVVDDERTAALAVASAPEFSFASPDFAGVGNFFKIRSGANGVEELECG